MMTYNENIRNDNNKTV